MRVRGRVLGIVVLIGLGVCSTACRRTAAVREGPPNVVLVSIDTLRADHLGCYGYARATSPNIDALAARSTLFRNAFSTASKTAESHMAMFTSLYPSAHGIFTLSRATEGDEVMTLGPDVRTLAQLLHEHGYATVGFHGGGFVDGRLGFDRGFDLYVPSKLRPALEWLEQHAGERPFFLFFHTYNVHDPYTPQPPFDSKFAEPYDGRIIHDLAKLRELAGSGDWGSYSKIFWKFVDKTSPRDIAHLRALYDGEIADTDTSVERLLDAIERLAPNTWFVLVSDHGEEFGEHGDFTHQQIYDELLRVPWIVHEPGQIKGQTIEEPVSTLDLAPTLLDVLSIPLVEQFQGRSLRPRIEGPGGPATRVGLENVPSTSATPPKIETTPIFSELPPHGLAAIRDTRWTLIFKADAFELYDHRADPGERRDLLATDAYMRTAEVRSAFESLRATLEHRVTEDRALHARNAEGAQRRQLDGRTVERMRELGYID